MAPESALAAPSFRWRVFGVAALSVGAALALVIVMGWQGLMARERDRLDDRLCMEGRRLVALAAPGAARDGAAAWDRLGPDLAQKLHVESAASLRARVIDAQGQLVWRSPGEWPQQPSTADGPAPAASGTSAGNDRRGDARNPGAAPGGANRGSCNRAAWEAKGQRWQAVRVQRGEDRAELAADVDAMAPDLRADLRQALLISVPLGVALALATALLLTAMTMRPLNRLREAMRGMSHRALDERLSADGEDREFRELIGAYNAMLDRLEASFRQASRFSADAAHELRTPLAILRGRLERSIGHTEGRAVQAELGMIQDEVTRLIGITRKLLLLSQADAGRLPLQREHTDLSATLHHLLGDADLLEEGLRIDCHIAPDLQVSADAALLQQALNNLLTNALRHAAIPGWLRVSAQRRDGGVDIVFANNCEPLDATARQHLFDRFYRADPAHGRRHDGTGLGLSLVREIARAHGGDAVLLDSPADEVQLRLWLPA